MGHEGSEYVSRAGEGPQLNVGDHVVLSSNPPCRSCRS
ncbi:alcohol dehydrogenase catalytic domain-containing protein [Ferrimicrobium sp.]